MVAFQLIQQKIALGYIDVEAKIRESIYDNRKLRIANIYGESAIVDKDFQKGIAGAVVNFEIQNFRCNLAQPNKIVETLKGLSNMGYDIVAIVRGGGELSTLSDPAIADQVLKLPCAFVCAIGHAVNKTLLDKIADKSFELPLHYGVQLREIVERAKEDLTNSKSALIDKVRVEVTKSFADTLKANEEQVKLLQEHVKNANARNMEMFLQYQKIDSDHKLAIEKIKQEKNTSQIIALIIGFAIAMLIIYIFKS
jgi:exonuclease VII large subunit